MIVNCCMNYLGESPTKEWVSLVVDVAQTSATGMAWDYYYTGGQYERPRPLPCRCLVQGGRRHKVEFEHVVQRRPARDLVATAAKVQSGIDVGSHDFSHLAGVFYPPCTRFKQGGLTLSRLGAQK